MYIPHTRKTARHVDHTMTGIAFNIFTYMKYIEAHNSDRDIRLRLAMKPQH